MIDPYFRQSVAKQIRSSVAVARAKQNEILALVKNGAPYYKLDLGSLRLAYWSVYFWHNCYHGLEAERAASRAERRIWE